MICPIQVWAVCCNMRTALVYLQLEYKKSMKILGRSVIGMLLSILLIIGGVIAVSFTVMQSQVFSKVTVAVAIPKEEQDTKMVTQFVSAMNSVRSVCDFIYMDSDTALQKVRAGECEAAIVFPETFYDGVNNGENVPARIYYGNGTEPNVRIFDELLTDGVSLLQIAQAGVYTMLAQEKLENTQMTRGEIGDQVSYRYIREALVRSDLFEVKAYSPMGEVSLYQYYFSSLVLLIMLLAGQGCGFLYRRQCQSVEQRLILYRVGIWKQSAIKVIVMTNVLWLIAMILCLTGYAISKILDYSFLYFDVYTGLGLLLLSLSMACFFHAVYGITGKNLYGAVVLLAVNVNMIICSGLLIPIDYLPKAVRAVGRILPLNIWNQFGMQLMFDTISRESIMALIGIAVVGIGIGACALWKKV